LSQTSEAAQKILLEYGGFLADPGQNSGGRDLAAAVAAKASGRTPKPKRAMAKLYGAGEVWYRNPSGH